MFTSLSSSFLPHNTLYSSLPEIYMFIRLLACFCLPLPECEPHQGSDLIHFFMAVYIPFA